MTPENMEHINPTDYSVLDFMPIGVFILNDEYRVLFWNKRIEAWSKIQAKDIIGEDIRIIVPTLNKSLLRNRLETVFSGGPPAVFSSQLHGYLIPAPLPDGSMRLQNATATALRKADNSGWNAIIVIEDVTDIQRRLQDFSKEINVRRRMEKALHKALDSAERAGKFKSQFLANMSHEIRTPLNGIFGMLQLLTESDLEGEQRDLTATALDSCRSLMTIINDILDLSKVEAGRLEIVAQRFRPRRALQTVAETFSKQCRSKDLLFEYEYDINIPEFIVGDRARFSQIFFNLVGNSVKFTDSGTIGLSAYLLPEPRNGSRVNLLFTITDTGIGIPDEKIKYVFDSFTRLDTFSTKKQPGAGLGLGIVKELVSLMGGTICLYGEEAKGTTICISLPFEKAETPEEKETSSAAQVPQDVGPLKVLIVEDNRINLITLTRLLEKLNHRAVGVTSGFEALTLLKKESFDCILMDIQMPDLDGIETTLRIRKADDLVVSQSIPIVAVTAHAVKSEKEHILASGMDAYIAKPVHIDVLRSVLEHISQDLRSADL